GLDPGFRRDDEDGHYLSGSAGSAVSSCNLSEEITPLRIGLLDQGNLPRATPFLHLLLAGDGGFGVLVHFVVDKAIAAVPRREAWHGLHLVLRGAACEVAGDADI